MELAKTQLLTDTFSFHKRGAKNKRQKSAPKANNSRKQRQPKDPKPNRTPLPPGLCRDCREPAMDGQTRCEECERRREQKREIQEEANRQGVKKRRERLTAAGLCRDCKGQPIPNQTRCENCAEKHRVQRRKYDNDRRARIREEKHQHKEK